MEEGGGCTPGFAGEFDSSSQMEYGGGDTPLDLQESLTLVGRWNMGGGCTPGFRRV